MSTKTSYLDIVSLVCNPILSTGRLVWKLAQEESPKVEKIIDLIWKRTGICAETKERKESERLYPKLVDTGWNGNNRVLYYRLPPGLSFDKIRNSLDEVVSFLKCEIVEKYLENHPKAHFSLTILSGHLLDYIEYSNEETKIKKDGLWIPLGWSRRGLEQVNLANDTSCHLMIGGATGAGKSTLARFFLTLLHMKYTPEELELWLCDLKHGADIALLGDNPRLVKRSISEPEDLEQVIDDAIEEIKRRYQLFNKARCGANIKFYNQKHKKKLPRIIVFMDEYSRLEGKEFDNLRAKITKTTGEARGAGVHFIVSCFRPTHDLISGTMKNNFPAVVAFKCNNISAQVLLGNDEAKSAKAIGKDVKGRALFSYSDQVLIQVPYVTDEVCTEIMSQYQKIIDIKAEVRPTELVPIQTV